MWIVPHLEKYKCLEQLSTAFTNHGSFRKTLCTISKCFVLENGDGRCWKDPYANISASVAATTSVSEGPPCHHGIE